MGVQSDASTAGLASHNRPKRTAITFIDEKNPRVQIGDIEKQETTAGGDDESDEEDLDALIEELESADPDAEIEEEIEALGVKGVPEELLQTDTKYGLSEPEVSQRRKKYGLNQMKEEQRNLLFQFSMFFVGPIQFVMEVSIVTLGCEYTVSLT